MPANLFPFHEYWWFYLSFTALVVLLLSLDLGVFHRSAHAVGFREASLWVMVWISLALIFCFGLYQYSLWRFPQVERLASLPGFDPAAAARRVALEFLTGYILEESLSVDNMFVFVVVFNYFAVPPAYQHRVLFYGILGALVFRAAFIAVGAVLIRFQVVVIVFGAALILTGIRMMFGAEKPIDPERNPVIRLFRRYVPLTPGMHGQRFLVRLGGRMHATPLLVCLLFLEMTDILFAIDSVPAIFAVTREPMIVFTSNIFAILGLRAMYFLLAGAVDRFYLLKYGLGFVLIFVGLKMVWLNRLFGGHFPIGVSLAIITGVLAGSILLSLLFPKRHPPPAAPEMALDPEGTEKRGT
ncbi:MAG: TerC family protein [Acidobacteria bacterium]|nr:TerC family protein [Acidobacteriota bacterium]